MCGSTDVHAGCHPTCSMTWAGSRSLKSICQSAKCVLKTTVTVRPWLLPVTDLMDRYPRVLATLPPVPARAIDVGSLLAPGVDEVGGGDGHPVRPHRLGVDCVDHRLRRGADHLGLGDDRRVVRRSAPRGHDEGAGQHRLEHQLIGPGVPVRRVGVAARGSLVDADGDRPTEPGDPRVRRVAGAGGGDCRGGVGGPAEADAGDCQADQDHDGRAPPGGPAPRARAPARAGHCSRRSRVRVVKAKTMATVTVIRSRFRSTTVDPGRRPRHSRRTCRTARRPSRCASGSGRSGRPPPATSMAMYTQVNTGKAPYADSGRRRAA